MLKSLFIKILSVLILFLTTSHQVLANDDLSDSQLKDLGRQMVGTILKGAELPSQKTSPTKHCWGEDVENYPNILVLNNSFAEDNRGKSLNYYKVNSPIQLEFVELLRSGVLHSNGKDHTIDYSIFRDFVYKFRIKTKGQYLKCSSLVRNEAFESCKNLALTSEKSNAFVFSVKGLLSDPDPEHYNERDLSHIGQIVEIDGSIESRIGVVYEHCVQDL